MTINLGERIRIARKKAGLTQGELAKRLGITYPTLNKYERGHRTPDAALLGRMAKILDSDPGWLLTGEDKTPHSPEVSPVPQTPVLGKIPGDFPDHVFEKITVYISLPDVPEGAYSIIVKGESMSPAIRDGDYAIFVPDKDIRDGDIVVISNEWGESMLRRYHKKDSKIYLVSDNPEYPVLEHNKNQKILGKVIAVWRRVKI